MLDGAGDMEILCEFSDDGRCLLLSGVSRSLARSRSRRVEFDLDPEVLCAAGKYGLDEEADEKFLGGVVSDVPRPACMASNSFCRLAAF